jgi:hypothetical protein
MIVPYFGGTTVSSWYFGRNSLLSVSNPTRVAVSDPGKKRGIATLLVKSAEMLKADGMLESLVGSV